VIALHGFNDHFTAFKDIGRSLSDQDFFFTHKIKEGLATPWEKVSGLEVQY
jgi:hypothetical protein